MIEPVPSSTMTEKVRELLGFLVRSMARHDLNGLVSRTATPTAIYTPDGLLVAHTRDDLLRVVKLRLKKTMTRDVKRVTAKIIDVEEKAGQRASFLAQWEFWGAGDIVLQSNLIRYMVSQARDRATLTVEIVDILWMSEKGLAQRLLMETQNGPDWELS